MEYAKTLIKRKNPDGPTAGNRQEFDIGDEESWTFIGGESDPDLLKRIQEWDLSGRVESMKRSKDDIDPDDAAQLKTNSKQDGPRNPTQDEDRYDGATEAEDDSKRIMKRDSLRRNIDKGSGEKSPSGLKFLKRSSRN